MNENEHGGMKEFVVDEVPFRVPSQTRRYKLWCWVWKVTGHEGVPPVPDSWCFTGTTVVYNTDDWEIDESRMCENCGYGPVRIMRRDGDIWWSCQLCGTIGVD